MSQFIENILRVYHGKLSLRKQTTFVNRLQCTLANNLFGKRTIYQLAGKRTFWKQTVQILGKRTHPEGIGKQTFGQPSLDF